MLPLRRTSPSVSGSTLHLVLLILLFAVQACNQSNKDPLPVIATLEIPYTFTNQDNRPVNQKMFKGKIYVADFFFTSCPTICPIMKSQMLRVYEKYKDDEQVVLLSHSIDPAAAAAAVTSAEPKGLDVFAYVGLGVWVIGFSFEAIADLQKSRFRGDPANKGGFIHSGSFTLVDRQGRIRGYYQGTEEEAVDRLIDDIARLINEN